MLVLKNIVLDFFKGVAIGVANVIPGFSGGTMAVILKIYERVIGGFSDITKHPLKVIKDLWAIIFGLAVGIILAIITIVKLLEICPLPTMLFFVGLLLGAIPDIYKEYESKGKFSYFNLIYFILAIALIVGLPFFTTSAKDVVEIDPWLLIILFILGAIAAAAMIIPGVSGSMILMIFGYYVCVTSSISNFLEALVTWNFDVLVFNFWILLVFGVGCIIGILLISKLISFLFKRYPKHTYALILGLLIASPFAMMFSAYKDFPNLFDVKWYVYLISLVALSMGLFVTLFLSKKGLDKECE